MTENQQHEDYCVEAVKLREKSYAEKWEAWPRTRTRGTLAKWNRRVAVALGFCGILGAIALIPFNPWLAGGFFVLSVLHILDGGRPGR